MAQDRLAAFEAQIRALEDKTRRGLKKRAEDLEAAFADYSPESPHEVRRIAHKIRGIAKDPELAAAAELVESIAAAGGPLDAAQIAAVATRARAIAAESTTASTPTPPESLKTDTGRVLVVDDDPAILRMMEMTLRRMGKLEVVSAATHTEATAALESGPFDVLLFDAMMPGTTGLELTRRARELALQKDAVIVILSAATAAQLGWNDDGPDHWWRKPLPPVEAVRRVQDLITHQRAKTPSSESSDET
ncbi:MAG: response regulator [Myxococcota bacterium]